MKLFNSHKEVLENRIKLDDFIHQLSWYNIDNCSGSSYRNVRLCYYENGILLISYHHCDNICHISIASNPNSSIISGCDDSRSSGDPSPKPSGGELVKVWDNTWLKDGPWVAKINDLIDNLCDRVKLAVKNKEEKERLKVEEYNLKQKELNEKLLQSWQ